MELLQPTYVAVRVPDGTAAVGVIITDISETGVMAWFALSACAMSLADVQARTRMLVCVASVNVNVTAFPVDAAAVQAVWPTYSSSALASPWVLVLAQVIAFALTLAAVHMTLPWLSVTRFPAEKWSVALTGHRLGLGCLPTFLTDGHRCC
jgi:hypothetical protein